MIECRRHHAAYRSVLRYRDGVSSAHAFRNRRELASAPPVDQRWHCPRRRVPTAGDTVLVRAPTALVAMAYSPASQIRARMWTFTADTPVNAEPGTARGRPQRGVDWRCRPFHRLGARVQRADGVPGLRRPMATPSSASSPPPAPMHGATCLRRNVPAARRVVRYGAAMDVRERSWRCRSAAWPAACQTWSPRARPYRGGGGRPQDRLISTSVMPARRRVGQSSGANVQLRRAQHDRRCCRSVVTAVDRFVRAGVEAVGATARSTGRRRRVDGGRCVCAGTRPCSSTTDPAHRRGWPTPNASS